MDLSVSGACEGAAVLLGNNPRRCSDATSFRVPVSLDIPRTLGTISP